MIRAISEEFSSTVPLTALRLSMITRVAPVASMLSRNAVMPSGRPASSQGEGIET